MGSQKTAPRGGLVGPGANGEPLAREGREQPRETIELGLAEAAADAPGVAQRSARSLVDAEQQRTDARVALALAGHPAADDELLAARAS